MNKKISKKTKVTIFFLTIIIVIIVLILLSIIFATIGVNKDISTGNSASIIPSISTNATNTISPSNSSGSSEGTEHETPPDPNKYNTVQKIQDELGGKTDTGDGDPTVAKTEQDRYKNIKTISGKPFNIKAIPLKYNDWVIIDISLTNNTRLAIERCVTKENKTQPTTYKDDLKKALQKIDVSDQNTFDYSLDTTC